jgi:hypothetical protein
MDALAPPALAPRGPGATGAPLLDWVLCDPGLAAAVYAHLEPTDVLGLRVACKAACASVAGHAWDTTPPALQQSWTNSFTNHRGFDVTGRTALRRWRACFPAARLAIVNRARTQSRYAHSDEVTDADLAAHCAGVPVVSLWGLTRVTDAALAALSPVVLLLCDLPSVTGAGWAHMTALQQLSACRIGFVDEDGDYDAITDAHFAALAACTHMSLEAVGMVTDACVAHLRAVRHLDLEITDGARFTGAGLATCGALVVLWLHYDIRERGGDGRPVLADGCLRAAGRSLRDALLGGVAAGDGVLTGLSALERLRIHHCTRFAGGTALCRSLPRLVELDVNGCPDFTGAGVGGLGALTELAVQFCDAFVGDQLPPRLTQLQAESCASFTGTGLGSLPALQRVDVRECPRVSATALQAAVAGGPALCEVIYGMQGAQLPDYAGTPVITDEDAAAVLGPAWEIVQKQQRDDVWWKATRVLNEGRGRR